MEQIKPVSSQPIQQASAKAPAAVAPPSQKQSAVEAATPQFISPMGKIDAASGVLVVEIRDTSTGEVAFQYPAKKAASVYSAPDKANVSPDKANVSPDTANVSPDTANVSPDKANVSTGDGSKADAPSDKPVVAATLGKSE